MSNGTSWSKNREWVNLTRDLWISGLSTRNIANTLNERLGLNLTKNAIVGCKKREIDKHPEISWGDIRKSPIIRCGGDKSVVRRRCPTPPGGYVPLPPLPSLERETTITVVVTKPAPRCVPLPAVEKVAPTLPARDPSEPLRRRDGSGCLNLKERVSESGRTTLVACDSPLYSILKPYCEDCASILYVKTKREMSYAEGC